MPPDILRAMSDDEMFLTLACLAASGFLWVRSTYLAIHAMPRRKANWPPLAYLSTALACGILLFILLRHWAADDVRNDAAYLLQYMAMGTTWIAVCVLAARPILGLSDRDDVFERRTPAATVALQGVLLSMTLVFAGANFGNGPGWGCVLFTGLLGSTAWFLTVALASHWADLAHAVTVDDDLAAAIRHAGLSLAAAAICARAEAGDWISKREAVSGFAAAAWPLAGLVLLGIGASQILRRAPGGMSVPYRVGSTMVALIQIILAGCWLVHMGWW